MVRMDSYHQMPLSLPSNETLMTFVKPLMMPAAMMPGSRGTKMLATRLRKAWTGLVCFAFCAALLCCASEAASPTRVPFAMPVCAMKASSTLLTLPGPNTICRVSASTTPMTPSICLIASMFTNDMSRMPTRNRVMHASLERTFSFPPSSTSSCRHTSLTSTASPTPSSLSGRPSHAHELPSAHVRLECT